MTIEEFWHIIEQVDQASKGDMDRKCELLKARLTTLDAASMREFRSHFDECNRHAYDWGLWGAAYVINGGCSDDSFSDFRSSLISRGRRIFESALADPDSLADLSLSEEDACYEGYAYAVTDAEKKVLGEVPSRAGSFPSEPGGEPWDEEDQEALARRFPRLSRKYLPPGDDEGPKKPWWKIW